MKRFSFARFLIAGALVGAAALTGCASSDIDQLRSELADVKQLAQEAKATADQAKQEAEAATAASGDAKAAAAQAQATADEAKAMSQATDEKLNKMFDKRMRK